MIMTIVLLMSGCAVATKTLNETTDTTLAERCADYRMTIATYESILAEGRQDVHPIERAAYLSAKSFIARTPECAIEDGVAE